MVANLLRQCGLCLGDAAELIPADPANPLGHWEDLRFVEINNEILRRLGGQWYVPPSVSDGWATKEELTHVKKRAELLLREFCGQEQWGWKDPRSSLTLPFWTSLLPDLKVIVCLRNPLEVCLSLRRRPVFKHAEGNLLWNHLREIRAKLSLTRRRYFSTQACLQLWQIYNQRILEATSSQNRIITHYEAYLRDAKSELRRVSDFLGMAVAPEVIEQASKSAVGELRHNRFSAIDLRDRAIPAPVVALYSQMCDEANFDHGWR